MDRIKRDLEGVIALLRREFETGAETVQRDARLPSGGHLADVVFSVWGATKDNPSAIGEAAFDLIETANCVFENGFSDIEAAQVTESHGTLREIVLAQTAPAP